MATRSFCDRCQREVSGAYNYLHRLTVPQADPSAVADVMEVCTPCLQHVRRALEPLSTSTFLNNLVYDNRGSG
jgi:hypothetical protein